MWILTYCNQRRNRRPQHILHRRCWARARERRGVLLVMGKSRKVGRWSDAHQYTRYKRMNHSPTSNGSQFAHRAQERMMSKKPTARTKLSRMIAAIETRGDKISKLLLTPHSIISYPAHLLFNPAAMVLLLWMLICDVFWDARLSPLATSGRVEALQHSRRGCQSRAQNSIGVVFGSLRGRVAIAK